MNRVLKDDGAYEGFRDELEDKSGSEYSEDDPSNED